VEDAALMLDEDNAIWHKGEDGRQFDWNSANTFPAIQQK